MLWMMHQVKTFCKSSARFSKFLLSFCFIFFVLSQWYLTSFISIGEIERALLSVLVIRSSRTKRDQHHLYLFIIIYYSENNCKFNKMRKKMLTYVDKLVTLYWQLWQKCLTSNILQLSLSKSLERQSSQMYFMTIKVVWHIKVHLRTS